jgi:hypothetical protein
MLALNKNDVGLANVENTSDANKIISTGTQTALNLKAPINSPTFTGIVTLPTGSIAVTQTTADNSTKLATTAYADAAVGAAVTGKQNTLTNSSGLAGALNDETGTGLAVFATSPTLTSPALGTPSALVGTNITGTATTLNIGGNAATVTTNANLTGEVTSSGNATTVTNAAVIGKVLTGYTAGAGTVAATDNILQAIQKVDGNDALKAPLASPTFTGTPSLPSVNKVAITAPATGSTLTIVDGKTLTASNTLTLAGTDGSTLNVGTGGILGSNAYTNTAFAPLASPTFTGTPTLPTGTIAATQTALNSTTAVATTAFVTTADNLKADLASPTFTGTPSLPSGTTGITQTALTSNTTLATTAYADAAAGAAVTGKQNTLTNSAGLAGALNDKTGTGLAVFATSPTFTTPTLGNASGSSLTLGSPLTIANGGTGSNSYSGAQTNLGFAKALISTSFTTTSTALVPVGLGFAVGANETWQFSISLLTGSDNTGGIQFGFSFPADGTLMATVVGTTNTATAFESSVITANLTIGTSTYNIVNSQLGVVRIQGIIKTGPTPGNLQLQVSKGLVGTATIGADSYLTAQKF